VVCTAAVTDGIRESVPVFESSELTQLYTDYMKAKQELMRTTRELERLQDLLSHNAIAGKEVVAAENDKINATATLAGVESRMLTVGLSPAELSKLDPDVALLIANVPESEISSVQLHEDAQVEFDSFKGNMLHGRVSDIGKAVDPTTRSFIVRISLRDKEHVLRPGMFARSSFGEDISRRFVIPQGAIVTVQGKSYVFITKDKHSFERREITISQQSKNDFVVTSGLAEGDVVVSSGALLLKGLSFGS
jgi:multidrug efflux pump subunit AcrA (membrane-fusion protein)